MLCGQQASPSQSAWPTATPSLDSTTSRCFDGRTSIKGTAAILHGKISPGTPASPPKVLSPDAFPAPTPAASRGAAASSKQRAPPEIQTGSTSAAMACSSTAEAGRSSQLAEAEVAQGRLPQAAQRGARGQQFRGVQGTTVPVQAGP
ncbi:hypothetical protein TSOC_012358 [Tetrabaena socialis]|uniref:Uncharacterized protein n=1 Tax=Tetrabaena socialis TaxID=47790 RepID=A0A2J7ZN96_9CHLO|nr:hypothetical protein TSOC_012358 [Tetrabaena socialis]|eukprot:PNH01728.1 hypothetical protein TSOC_012358 [Tetrabaena socialis]